MTRAIAIIGAGPAGLIAAKHLARAGCSVTVFERMPMPARKFLLAGRGGLNLTHSEPLNRFLERYGEAAAHMAPLIEAFPPEALRSWAHDLGQPTFIGTSGRVFPEAMKASPLLRAWLRRLTELGVVLGTRHRWTGWNAAGALTFDTPQGEAAFRADATLLALGGASWPHLGSDGGWVKILAERGVEIAPLRPANCGFFVDWSAVMRQRFAGEPLKRVALSFAGRTVLGEAMISAEGIEGGAVYALAAPLREALMAGPATLHVDLRPDMTAADIVRRLGAARKGETQTNLLRKAAGLSPAAIGLLREAGAGRLPADAAALARLIKAVPMKLTGARPIDRAISTAGGVAFASLDEGLMLKALPGVFVAGEMLDWEAPTGGYLLQGCFATGIAAAKAMAGYLGVPHTQ